MTEFLRIQSMLWVHGDYIQTLHKLKRAISLLFTDYRMLTWIGMHDALLASSEGTVLQLQCTLSATLWLAGGLGSLGGWSHRNKAPFGNGIDVVRRNAYTQRVHDTDVRSQ